MTGLPRPLEAGIAAAALAATAPLLVGTALLVRATSKGPALFAQLRVGQHGRTFTMLKFRTMRAAAGGPEVTARGDDRITRVGRVLRKTKLDELPELWNILRGEMSFVGPRPEVPRYVDMSDARWQRVLSVRPGLTDPVTLRLRNEEELLSEVPAAERDDFYRRALLAWKLRGYQDYLDRRTWTSDLSVLFHTLAAVARPDLTPPPTADEIRGTERGPP